MARTIKAQTIANIEETSTISDTGEMLISQDGNTNKVSVKTLKGVFGESSGGSGGGSSGGLGIEVAEFSPNGYGKEEPAISFNATGIQGSDLKYFWYTDAYEIKEDCVVYMHILADCVTTGSGYVEFQVQLHGTWFTVCKQIAVINANTQDAQLDAHFKAYAGLKVRAVLRNATDSTTSGFNIDNSHLFITMIKNSGAFGNWSRSYSLTVSKTAGADGYYSEIIPANTKRTVNVGETPQEIDVIGFPFNGLISVTGYFSTNGSIKTAYDDTYYNVYLQYRETENGEWINLARKFCENSNKQYNFGMFYVAKGAKIRMVSNAMPSDTAMHNPYASCTGVVKYEAIIRAGDDEYEPALTENTDLSTQTQVETYLDSGCNEFTFNIWNTADSEDGNMVLFTGIGYESPMYIKWQDNAVEQYQTENAEVLYKYGYLSVINNGTYTAKFSNNLTSFAYSGYTGDYYGGYYNTANLTANVAYLRPAQWCKTLTHAKFASNMAYIGERAFWDCINVDYVDIPSTVSVINGSYTWKREGVDDLMKLSAITFEGASDDVENRTTSCYNMDRTWSDCRNLESINLERTKMDGLGQYTFYRCYNLKSLSIPNGCISALTQNFYACTSLTSLYIPTSISVWYSNNMDYSTFNTRTGTYLYAKLSGDEDDYLVSDRSELRSTTVVNELRPMCTKVKADGVLANKKINICDKKGRLIVDSRGKCYAGTVTEFANSQTPQPYDQEQP